MIHFDAENQRWVDNEADVVRSQRYEGSARAQRQLLTGSFAVLAVCGLVFGVWALGWKDEPDTSVDGRPQLLPSSQKVTSPPEVDSPEGMDKKPTSADVKADTASRSAPAGFVVCDDPEGFRIAVPKGWDRRVEARDFGSNVIDYGDPDGPRQLQIFFVDDADPYSSLKQAENGAEKFKDYDRKAMSRLENSEGAAAARFEYSYDSKTHGGKVHVIDHRFEAEDGELYAIIAYGPAGGDADEEKELVDTALSTFCPDGADCEKG
jgi:hypothetical protein